MARAFTTDPPVPDRAYGVRAYIRDAASPTGVSLREWVQPHPITWDWDSAVRRLHAERTVDSEPQIKGGWPPIWYLDVDSLDAAEDRP